MGVDEVLEAKSGNCGGAESSSPVFILLSVVGKSEQDGDDRVEVILPSLLIQGRRDVFTSADLT